MIKMHKIIDGFLDNYNEFRQHCDDIEYGDVVNPIDGITYPGVSQQVPIGIYAEVVYKAQQFIEQPIQQAIVFLRQRTLGAHIPQSAHTDTVMGNYGMLLYMNRVEHCQGGTTFLRHIDSGMVDAPINVEQLEIMERDCNVKDKWQELEHVDMVTNRALMFDCSKIHRADKPETFGSNNINARLVLTAFFITG